MLLFDIDGTLLLAGDLHQRTFEVVLDEVLGLDVHPDWYRGYHGWTDKLIIQDLLEQEGVPEAIIQASLEPCMKAMAAYYRDHLILETGKIMRGVKSFLTAVDRRGMLRGLVTGNIESIARDKLARFGIESGFAIGGFGSDPHEIRADLIRLAIDRAEYRYNFIFTGKNAVYIADSPNDVRAARAASVPIIIIDNALERDYDFSGLEPDLLLPDLRRAKDLFSFVEGLKQE
jgi:beta-phosphoglucomutase-like phosphatase (HAD superfamily)